MLMAFEKGADADRQRRRPLQPDRVPRPQARRHVLDLPHPAADRREAGRRQGGEPALQPELDPGAGRSSSCVAFLILLTILIITSPALNDVFELFWLKIRIWLGV